MELKKITDRVCYIPGVVNIGCIIQEHWAILIDTGLEAETAKKVIKCLAAEGLAIKAIINTHSHADHCGGNAHIKEKTGALIYAPELEESFVKYPYLEPVYLFSGAAPIQPLQTKFLMAKPSPVDYVIGKDERFITIEKLRCNIVDLPGHSMNQIGIEVDDVLFCGDAFISKEVLDKHRIPFNMDIKLHRRTLQHLKESQYKLYLPSHCPPVEKVEDIIEANLRKLEEIDERLLTELTHRKTMDQIMKALCDGYDMSIQQVGQYYLLHTAIMAHISGLVEMGKVGFQLDGNTLYWEKI